MIQDNLLMPSFFRCPGFVGSPEAIAANELLDGYENHDDAVVSACVNSQVFTFLDNEVSR